MKRSLLNSFILTWKYLAFILLAIVIVSCERPTQIENNNNENFWVFFLAGQSNMAGRGVVAPEDTVTNPRILVLDTAGNWILAKEPLHPYEPNRQGLDCGLSFGREMIRNLPDSITIGLIPCAVGGSSIEQWVGDSVHRNVKLFSNLVSKVKAANQAGVIKGILWHQGESNAHPSGYQDYRSRLNKLFTLIRFTLNQGQLPIIMGELGEFIKLRDDNGAYIDSVNLDMRALTESNEYNWLIETGDLTDKGDSLHFSSESLRTMGSRYAQTFLQKTTGN